MDEPQITQMSADMSIKKDEGSNGAGTFLSPD